MADIFISYSRTDRPRVQALADAFSAHGWTVWWDRQIAAGRTFDHVIAEALAAARCVVVVWSNASIASDWVREEADEGRRRSILLPVLFDGVRPPLGFGRIQAADLGDWHGDTSTDAFRALMADITTMLGAPPAAAATPAVEPVATAPVERASPPTPPPAPPPTPPRVLSRSWSKVAWLAGGAVAAVLLLLLVLRELGGGAAGQPKPVTSAADQPTLRLSAMVAKDSEPLPSGVAYEVFEAAQDAEGKRKRVAGSPEYREAPRFQLPEGRYYVTAAHGSATAATELELPARTLVQQTLNLHAGVLRPTARLSPAAAPIGSGVEYEVFDAAKDAEGNRKRIAVSPAHRDPPRFTLPAGRYYVTARHGNASAAQEVVLDEGDNKALPLDLNASVLLPTAVLSDGSMPLKDGVTYDVDEAAKDAEGKSKRVTSSPPYLGAPRLQLPAGGYVVNASHGYATAQAPITLAPGETRKMVLNLHAGVLVVAPTGPNGRPLDTGVSYEIYEAAKDAEGVRKRIGTSPPHMPPPKVPLPRGRYYVTASASGGSSQAEIEVPEGVVTRLDLKLVPGGRDPR